MRAPALTLLATSLLTACSSGLAASLDDRQNAGPCPTAGALYEASRIVRFVDEEAEQRYNNIAYTGEIVGVRLFCRYIDDEPLAAEVEIDFAFGKGPQGTSNRHDYNYFIAVTRRNSRVLNKQVFSTTAEFGNERIDGQTEVVSQIVIPRLDSSISGVNFEVLVGFDLSDSELEFNKAGQRYRLDADSR